MYNILFDNVHKSYGKKEVIRCLNFEIREKERLVFLGPSGCGKSTTLRMIAGFEEISRGDLYMGGRRVNDMAPGERNIAMVFQSYALFPHMDVWDNIIFGLRIRKTDPAEIERRAKTAIGMLNLQGYEHQAVHALSGGQKQRVALCRALVKESPYFLLDEPLSNLDAKLRESMRFEISGLQKKLGITVIYVTHDQSEAMTMSDRIVVMSMGKVQQIGKPVDVYSHPANQMVADFVGLVNFIPSEVRGDGKVYLENTDISFPNEKNLSGKVVLAVRPENISLHKDHGMIEGLLHHHFYLGDSIDYRVQVKGHFIRVIVKGAEFGKFKDGDKVFLDFDKVLTFPQQ